MIAATVKTARAMRFQVHLNFWLSSVTQLCPLGTATEVPEMLGGCGCSLFSFTIGLRFSCFLPGDVCKAGCFKIRSYSIISKLQSRVLLRLAMFHHTGGYSMCCVS